MRRMPEENQAVMMADSLFLSLSDPEKIFHPLQAANGRDIKLVLSHLQ